MRAGYRVLVVENEALAANGICEALIEAEGVPVEPIPSVRKAHQLIRTASSLDAALLDVNLGDGSGTSVLETADTRGIATAVYTGGAVPEDVRHRHPDLITLAKPVPPARLIWEIRKVIAGLHPHLPAE